MLLPVALVPVRGVIVSCCLDYVLAFVVSVWLNVVVVTILPFKKKKKITSASLVVVTKRGSYKIRNNFITYNLKIKGNTPYPILL
jgi:hypothetical protein